MADQAAGFNPNSSFAKAMREKGMDKADAAAYDSFREGYFNQRIATRLTPADRQKKREEFMQRTQRPKLSGVEQLKEIGLIGLGRASSIANKTFGSIVPDRLGGDILRSKGIELEQDVEARKKDLDWRGQRGGTVADISGATVAYALETEAGGRALRPLASAKGIAGPLAAGMSQFPKMLPIVGRTLGFASLMGLEAEPGKKTSAFTTGMGWGAFGETTGAVLGGLWKYFKSVKALPTPGEVDSLLKDMAIGDVAETPLAKDVHRALAEGLQEVSKEPGYLSNLKMHMDDSLHNPMVALEDGEGRQRMSPIPTKHGVEKAFKEITQAIDSKWKVSSISHNEFDTDFVNDLMAKLKERYEPWSPTPSQIGTSAANKGIDIGGGTARMDNKVLKFHFAKSMPSPEEARHFIGHAIGETKGSNVDSLMRDFDNVWNPFGNWIERSAAADKLEAQGLHDILPSPEVRARWKPSEGMNLPAIFNEKGWYERLDRWKGLSGDIDPQTGFPSGGEVRLDVRQKAHLTSAMKTVWDPAVPTNSAAFKSALRTVTQVEGLEEFLPGIIMKDDVGALLNEGRAGTEGASKAAKLVDAARNSSQLVATREHLYQQIGRLAEVFSKEKDIDQIPYIKQYGRATVSSAMDMAALMWERAEGDLLNVKWDEDLLRKGIHEGILPPIDPSGKPLTQWFDKGEQHLAQGLGVTDTTSLRQASLESRVLRLAEMYNVDPKNIDKELLAEVGEAEVARAKEIADSAKKANVSVYDSFFMEEVARLGKYDDFTFSPRSLPPSERPSFEPGEPSGLPLRNVRLEDGKVGQFAYKVARASSGLPSRLYVMFNDVVAQASKFKGSHSIGPLSDLPPIVKHDLEILAQQNGIELSKTPITMVHRPNKGFDKALSAPLVWHEDAHGMLSQIGFNQATADGKTLRNSDGALNKLLGNIRAQMPEKLQKTWDALGRALDQKFEGLYTSNVKGEEGFVHAATAIRYGNHGDLAHFAAVDTSVEHVYETVQEVASKLRQEAGKMAPGASKNFIMDRLGLMENFSNVDRYKAVKEVAEQMFADVGEDLRSISGHSGLEFFDKFSSIIDKAESSMEGRTYSPNYTSWAEAAGARHALYPSQLAPGRVPPPMPETGIEDGWHFVGPALLWEKIAPTMSWANWVDKHLNEKYATKGAYLPLADRVKAVEEAYRAGGAWLDTNKKSAAEFLTGSKQKLESFGYLMTKEPKQWTSEIVKLGFTNDDIARFKQAYAWMKAFQNDTGIPVMNYYVEDYQRLANREFDPSQAFAERDPSKMGTFQRLITTGELNPRDLHLGRTINVLLREGMEKKFTGNALRDLRQVIDKRVDGKYILGDLRAPLQRFHDYMKGIPDNGGRMITRFTKDLEGGINSVIDSINKRLPAGYKAPKLDGAGNLVRRMILANYVANIGGRPAIAIRDSMQMFVTSMPVIGVKTLAKGFVKALEKENWELASKAGVPLQGKNVEDVFGDIFSELPAQKNTFDKGLDIASRLLAPSRWGHNVARRVVFAGVYDDALSATRAFRKTGDAKKFLEDSGLWFADEARQKQLLSLAKDKYVDHKEVAKQVGLELNDLTLWAYRRGTQPGFLKTGVGRVFGQYGLWPMNYIDFIRRMSTKVVSNPKKALPALASFIAVNYGLITEGRKALGVDVSKWFGLSPMGYTGSPHFQFTLDVAKSLQDSTEGRQARKRVLQYPMQFVPASNELRTLKEVWGQPMFDDEGHPTQAMWKAAGFKTYRPDGPTVEQLINGEVDPEHYIHYEMGGK